MADVEAIVDKIVAEVTLFSQTPEASGGCSDIIPVAAVYWGDPGILPVNSYPAFTVQPLRELEDIETTGYEVLDLEVLVTLLVDSRDYWDADVLEASGDRKMVQVIKHLRRWFRKDSNRSLDGMAGIREVRTSATDYMVQVRGSVIAKSAQVTLTVNAQYQRQS